MDCYPSEIDRNSTGIAFSSNIYICFYFIINIQSHANKKNERLLVSFHFLKKKMVGTEALKALQLSSIRE
jgi:hypothetical protein